MNMPLPSLEEITQNMNKACADMQAAMTSYVDAATKSNNAAWQGMEAMTRDMSEWMQETYSRAIEASTSLMSAKSPQQAAATHADYLKDCYDNMLAGGGKLSELSMKAAKGAIDPLAQHASQTMETIMKKAKSA